MTITTDGTAVSSSDITIGTTTLSSDGKTKTFPITVRNFKGGDVVITISSGALVQQETKVFQKHIHSLKM